VTAPLGQSLRRLGVLLITLSSVTPAASVFIMAQQVIQQAGDGALWCFLAAGVLGLTNIPWSGPPWVRYGALWRSA
jgi:hypothetical protein